MQDDSVYLGLGSNVGNRTAYLRGALNGLRRRGLQLRSVSSFYLTEPDLRPRDRGAPERLSASTVPPAADDHPWYVNCVAAVDGVADATALLDLCRAVETECGRERGADATGQASTRAGAPRPRTLDVDVLLIGDRVIERGELRVPHPRMQERRFVLAPLAEIAPRARHPVAGATVVELLTALPERERVWLLAPPPEIAA